MMHAPDPVWSAPDLTGRIALVTGATRGVGRGIAAVLGECGATVVVTGRSSERGTRTENLPGTVEDTAREVDHRGGTGIPVRVDHFDDDATAALFEQIRTEHGRLDLLVNNVWAGYERGQEAKFDAPFWRQPLWRWDLCLGSLRAQYLCSQLAVPLMQQRGGLLVVIGFTAGSSLLGQVAYDVAKQGADRMVRAMAQELRHLPVIPVGVHPGFVRTERVEAAWDLLGEGPARIVHTPEYVGRAVACLAADVDLGRHAGLCLPVGDLARAYEFTDVDGKQPPRFELEGRMTLATRMERLNRVARDAAGARA